MNTPIPFGKYLLLSRINLGGMAEVYMAKIFGVEGFERIVAIKRILPNMADDDEFINMFVDEARIVVQLTHPNIVQIYELGRFEEQYYIAMEYVSGKDLRQILEQFRKKNTRLPLEAAVFIAALLCEGLDYAHRKLDPAGKPLHIVHRDVSPQNILISYEGAVKITDFGIAKAEDRASKTQAGVLKGKFGYMSPEQVRGGEVDNRSDIFAVGILLYEMLAGKRLFVGESDFATLEKVRNAEVPSLREAVPDIPEALEKIVLKALAREPKNRYEYASLMHDELQQVLLAKDSRYQAKHLSEFMHEEFQADIAAEVHKIEELHRLPPPSSPDALVAAAKMQAASTASADWTLDTGQRNEKTLIFESDFQKSGALLVDKQTTNDLAGMDSSRLVTGIYQYASTSKEPVPSSAAKVDTQAAALKPKSFLDREATNKDQALFANQASLFTKLLKYLVVSLVVLGLFLFARRFEIFTKSWFKKHFQVASWFKSNNSTPLGAIILTSVPAENVQVYLDEELIGRQTPLTRLNLALGAHTLRLHAAGYLDKVQQFILTAETPTTLHVELEKEAAAALAAMPGGTIDIYSEPDGALVRLGGLPQGTTPLTLKGQDTSRPVVFDITKSGFRTQIVTVSFAAGETQKAIRIILTPIVQTVVPSTLEGDNSLPPATNAGEAPGRSGGESTGRETSKLPRLEGRKLKVKEAEAANAGDKPRGKTTGGVCLGSSGKLSIMTVGLSDCNVRFGKQDLGAAPLFRKSVGAGSCLLEVSCPDGKHFAHVIRMGIGEERKIIIKPGMWQ